MRTIIQLIKFYKKFGINGIGFYLDMLKGKSKYLKFTHKNFRYPILLRRLSTDIYTFDQIIFHEYNKISIDTIPKIILDCGANIGLTTVYFKNKYPHAIIIAVEIEDSNFELLSENTKKYRDIILYKNAIWNKKTNLILTDNGIGEWGFSAEEFSKDEAGTENDKQYIVGITIKEIMQAHSIDKIDILKIDIEGGEKYLFESNYDEWIPKVKVLIIELHDRSFPFSSSNFFRAIVKYKYLFFQNGDNIIIYFK